MTTSSTVSGPKRLAKYFGRTTAKISASRDFFYRITTLFNGEKMTERKPGFFSEGSPPQDFLFSEGTTPHESLKTLVFLAVQMRKTLF